jgi:hypothetical protein
MKVHIARNGVVLGECRRAIWSIFSHLTKDTGSCLKRSSASLDRMTQVNTDAFVMRICYAKRDSD